MGKRKIPKAVFEPLENAVAAELLAMTSFVVMVQKEAPLAIEQALENKKTFATLFEISGEGMYVDLQKQDWVPALEQCINYMLIEEKFEECIPIKKLIDKIKKQAKSPTKKTTKNKKNGSSSS